ncbi:uncharacterized protein METZ01_LOCUS205025, partial [marine metagenome]
SQIGMIESVPMAPTREFRRYHHERPQHTR